MAVETRVNAVFTADTNPLVSSLKRATDSTNQFANALPNADRAQQGVKTSTVALGAALGTLGATVFAKATSAVMNYARQGIEAAKQYEQTVISIEGIFAGTGMSMEAAADKTKSYLADLRDFAAETPFELPQTLDAVKRLLSIGYAADDVKDRLLPAIGDIVAALGQPASSISAVVYAFGQMKSAGRVLSQDLMQIGNALPGFNAKVAIANQLFQGDMAAMTKAMETGAVDSETAIDAIIKAMTEFGGAAGAMDRQSKTLAGVMSTFSDTINNALIDGLMPTIPVLSAALQELMPVVEALATSFAQALGPMLADGTIAFQGLAPVITAVVPPLIEIIAQFASLLGIVEAFSPILVLMGNVLGVIANAISALPGPILTAVAAFIALRLIMKKMTVDGVSMFTRMNVGLIKLGTSAKMAGAYVGASLMNMKIAMEVVALSVNKLKIAAVGAFRAIGVAAKAAMTSLGPIGIAFIAASAAMEVFAGSSASTENAVANLKAEIDATTGAISTMGKEWIASELRTNISDEDLAMLEERGINIAGFTAALEQGGPALDEYKAKLQAFADETNQGWSLPTERWSQQTITRTFEGMIDNYESAKEASKDLANATQDAAAAEDILSGSLDRSINAADRAAAKQTALTDVTDAAKAAVTALTDAYEAMNKVISEEAAGDKAVASIGELRKTLEDGSKTLKRNSDAGRENREAIRNTAQAWIDYAKATDDPIEAQNRLEQGERRIRRALEKSGIDPKKSDIFRFFQEQSKQSDKTVDQFAAQIPIANQHGIDTGKNFIAGILASLKEGETAVYNGGAAVGQAAADGTSDATKEGSPSRVAMQIGKWFTEGFDIGLRSGTKNTEATAKKSANKFIKAFRDGLMSGDGTIRSALESIFGSFPERASLMERLFDDKQLDKWNKANKQTLIQLGQMADLIDAIGQSKGALTGATVAPISAAGFGGALTEFPDLDLSQFSELQSEIQNAMGSAGSFGSVLSMFDSLDQGIQTYFKSMMKLPKMSKAGKDALRTAMDSARTDLQNYAREAMRLMAQRADIERQMRDEEKRYASEVEGINQTYDALDDTAAQDLKKLEDKWKDWEKNTLPTLEETLRKATAAFDEENAKLEELKKERDSFSKKIGENFEKFMTEGLDKKGPAAVAKTFQNRLKQVQQFTANIRQLAARGLDPSLVQEFAAQGVSGAGSLVKKLAGASDAQIAEINSAQQALGSEIQAFQDYSSAQWYESSIAQKEAILGPLKLAQEDAQKAIKIAQEQRDAELAAQQAHIQALRDARQAALDEADRQYKTNMDKLKADLDKANADLQANADKANQVVAGLSSGVSASMFDAGKKAIEGLIDGMSNKEGKLVNKIKNLSKEIVKALKQALGIASPSKVTAGIGQNISEGLVKGMLSREAMVGRAANVIAGSAVPSGALGAMGGVGVAGGGGTVINLTVNAGIGTSGAEVGRQIVDALKQYERRNGPVYAKA